jgi:hypothetical protein
MELSELINNFKMADFDNELKKLMKFLNKSNWFECIESDLKDKYGYFYEFTVDEYIKNMIIISLY